MAVEVIEGTLEGNEPPRRKRGYARYDTLRFAAPTAARLMRITRISSR